GASAMASVGSPTMATCSPSNSQSIRSRFCPSDTRSCECPNGQLISPEARCVTLDDRRLERGGGFQFEFSTEHTHPARDGLQLSRKRAAMAAHGEMQSNAKPRWPGGGCGVTGPAEPRA